MAWDQKNHVEASGSPPFFSGTVSLTSWDGQLQQSGLYGASANRPAGATGDFWGLMIAFGSAKPLFVQTTSGGSAGSGLTSLAVTFNAANTGGNQLLLDVFWQANNVGQEFISVSDDAGNTWVPCCLIQKIGFSASYIQTWYCADCATAGPVTVTVSESGGRVFSSVAIIASEYANLGTPAPLPLWAPTTAYNSGTELTDPLGHNQQVTGTGSAPHHSGASQPVWSESGGTTGDGDLTWTDRGAGVEMASANLTGADPLTIAMQATNGLNAPNSFLHLTLGVLGGGSSTIPAPTLTDPSGGSVPPSPVLPPGNQPTQPFFANLSAPPLQTPIIDAAAGERVGTPFQNRGSGTPSGDVQAAWAGWFNAVYQFLLQIGAAGGSGSLGVTKVTSSYTSSSADTGRILALIAATPQTLTLPVMPPNGTWNIFLQNIGLDNWTIDPNGLQIDFNSSSLTLSPGQGIYLSTDGLNYFTERGMGEANPVTAVTGTAPIVVTSGPTPDVSVDLATTSAPGVVQPDGTTITISGGVISAVGGGGGGALTQIAQVVLATAAPTVTFSSIPATYTSLMIVITSRESDAVQQGDIYMQCNGDTAAHYNRQFLLGSGTSASAGTQIGVAKAAISTNPGSSAGTGHCGSASIVLTGYAQTTFYKQAHSEGGWKNSSTTFCPPIWWEWESTAAITSILLGLINSANFVAGSTFTLYGIQ